MQDGVEETVDLVGVGRPALGALATGPALVELVAEDALEADLPVLVVEPVLGVVQV